MGAVVRMLIAVVVAWALGTGMHAASAKDAPNGAARARFAVALGAAKLGGDAWQALAVGLEDYPLYPYLEASALSRDLAHADGAAIERYLARYADLIPARDLRRDYLHRLAGAKDWTAFRRLYQPDLGLALACRELQARLAAGERLDAARDLANLMAAPSWPAACKPVLEWARAHQHLTRARLWQRVRQLADEGSADAIEATAEWMQGKDAALARRVALARRAPATALREARQWTDGEHARLAVTQALVREARRDDRAAAQEWKTLRARFRFSPDERHAVEAALALYSALRLEPEALAALTALAPAARTDATREWRVRVALAHGDWDAALAALDALSDEQQADETWRYWRARTLGKLGETDAAQALFKELAQTTTYFGFLAADWLGAPYVLCDAKLAGSADDERRLLGVPPLARAFEWHALGADALARREWSQAMAALDEPERRLAADLASRRGWYDRAIFTLNHGENLKLYAQRFPLAHQDLVRASAQAAGIDPAWVNAIIRAESAWVTDARSGADARGLMQVLPSTAREVSRREQLAYAKPTDLFDPAINVPLGTRHLARMAAAHDGAPWLATAAYNAGGGNLARWLPARRDLEPDVFVATIPFGETRAYVRRVMVFAVIYDWRMHGAVAPLSSRMPRVGEAWQPPGAATVRKQVGCPAVASG